MNSIHPPRTGDGKPILFGDNVWHATVTGAPYPVHVLGIANQEDKPVIIGRHEGGRLVNTVNSGAGLCYADHTGLPRGQTSASHSGPG